MTRDLAGRLGRRALFLGFLLLVVAFASALFMGLYANPRTALAAHVIGITGGLMLIATGLAFPALRLSRAMLLFVFWALAVSVWAGFAAQLVGAGYGLARMFVVTAAGQPEGPAAVERAVELVTKAITPLTILPCLVILWGLRGPAPDRS